MKQFNFFKKSKPKNYKQSETNKTQAKAKTYGISFIINYTDWLDRVLLLVALISGLISSGLYPMAFWIYGKIVTAFVNYGILKQLMKNDLEIIESTSSCNDKIVPSDIDVEAKVYEYVYYYVYFAFPILFAHLIAYFFWGLAAERISIKLRTSLYSTLITQDLNWFESFSSEETNALYNSIDKLRLGTGEKMADFIILMTRALASVIFGLYSCWKLALALASVLPISIFFFVLTVFMSKKFTIKENMLNGKCSKLFRQVFGTIKTVVVFGGESVEISKYEKALKSVEETSLKKGLILGFTSGLSSFFNYVSYAIWIAYGTYLYRNECEQFTAGNIIQTFSAFIISALAVAQAFPFVKELGDARLAANKLFKTLQLKPQTNIFDTESGTKLPESSIKGKLQFENVTFSYKSRPDKAVIKNFNLQVKPGQTVAIIGPSGCGKTTIIKLVARLFEPTSGRIIFDDHDTKSFNLNWWRSQLSIVSQEAVLFNMSFRDNIRLGNINATDQEIEEAAKAADIHNDILLKEKGYDTIVEHGGSRLSGGQRQRISIARAFLRKQSNLLIFDEATSALDNETEKQIKNSMEKLKNNKTTIVIAHRLSTIKDADIIVELNNGSVNSFGTHDQLVAKKEGYYYNLVKNDEPEEQRQENEKEEKVDLTRIISQIRESQKLRNSSVRKSKMINNEVNIPEDKHFFHKVWAMNRSEIVWIIFSSVAYFINGSIYPFVAFCFSQMVQIFTIMDSERNAQQSYLFTGIVIGLSVLSFLASFFLNFATTKTGVRLTIRAKILLFKTLMNKSMDWFDMEENKLSKLVQGMDTCPGLLKGYTAERVGLVLNFITGVGIPLGISFYYSWKLTFLVAIFIPVALLWGFMQGQAIRSNRQLSGNYKIDDAIQCASESVQNIHTVMINNLQVYFKEQLDIRFNSNIKRATVIILIESVFYGIGYVLFFFVQCTAFSYGSYLLKRGEIEGYNIVRIFASILFSSLFLGKIISTLTDIPRARSAAKWYFKVLGDPNENDENNGRELENFQGNIKFENVKFCYMNRPDQITLRNINVEFKNNESSALVGKSGCGKSTIMSLILKYYEPYSGRILIDGVDIKNINTRWLRKQIGLVSQEFSLFDGTINDNITYGLDKTKYSQIDITEAAIKADAHKFICELPQGYNTNFENVPTLSGGQKQRLALARALIRNPKILLLDEATSALDKESEKKIQKTIDESCLNRTSISITHRLTTIENCNQIYAIKNKTIAEHGTHEDLMNKKGYYYLLKQFEFSN